jgi:serine/threonine-protein kinase ATR
MDRIAPLLVSKIQSRRSMLDEACRFLAISPPDFLNVTLSHTLPYLFSKADRDSLVKVAEETQKQCHSLFLIYESKILARAFMASKPGQTRSILNFIAAVLTEAANGNTIEIDSIIKSSIVNLVAELVMFMGDEDLSIVKEVRRQFPHSPQKSNITCCSGYTCRCQNRGHRIA